MTIRELGNRSSTYKRIWLHSDRGYIPTVGGFQMAPHLIEQLCPSELSFAFHFDWTTFPHWLNHAPPHPTPPNPMSNVACTSDATSNQRQHAPPHPTQPYVQRSVHIRCNFKPTSTCPTPPHPTQPYVQHSVHIRCNFIPTSTCPTPPPHPTPPQPLSTHVGRSKNRYNKPLSPAKVQPSVVEPKLPLWESDVAKARVDNIAMGSLTEALAYICMYIYIFNLYLFMCIHMYIYICIYTYVYIHMYMYLFKYVYIYICLYLYIYIYL